MTKLTISSGRLVSTSLNQKKGKWRIHENQFHDYDLNYYSAIYIIYKEARHVNKHTKPAYLPVLIIKCFKNPAWERQLYGERPNCESLHISWIAARTYKSKTHINKTNNASTSDMAQMNHQFLQHISKMYDVIINEIA